MFKDNGRMVQTYKHTNVDICITTEDYPGSIRRITNACPDYIKLVEQECRLHLDMQRVTWAQIPLRFGVNDVRFQWVPLLSNAFTRFMYYLQKYPDKHSTHDAVLLLDSHIAHEYIPGPIYNRYAHLDNGIYCSLNNTLGQYVHITPDGFEIVKRCPVPMATTGLAMPVPQQGESLHLMKHLFRIPEESYPLIYAWLLCCMWGKGKYPMLYLLGGQDSGKSTMTMLLRNLIDPVSTPMTGKPPSIDDLYLKASKHAVLAFNNLSAMSNDFSDAFCTLTFEGGYERRTKHTDGDLTAYSNRVPIIMNGIELATYRPDFLDRCFIVRLPENDDLKHGYDEELQARFREAQPYFLGALFNGLAAALRDYKKTRLERVPRIADEARVITAAEPAIGMASGTFVNLLLDRRQEERELQVELSPLASLLHDHILRDKTEWIGTRKQLLLIAKAQAKNYGDLPRTSQKVTSELERLAPVLKSVNIKVDMHHGRESWGRLMRIYRIPPPEAKQKRERLKLKPKVGHKKPARSAKS